MQGKVDFYLQKLNIYPSLSPCTSINSKWIKDLNVRSETVKLIQDHIGIGDNLGNGTAIAQELRESIDKWNYMKLKNFCTANETVTRLKRQPTE
jgi:hypothetical protein